MQKGGLKLIIDFVFCLSISMQLEHEFLNLIILKEKKLKAKVDYHLLLCIIAILILNGEAIMFEFLLRIINLLYLLVMSEY